MVWTCDILGKGKGNKERYEKLWNPFNTPVKVYSHHGSWDAPVDVIYNMTKEFLEELK
jgi:hypothetical protein